jgi:hypothetical protein
MEEYHFTELEYDEKATAEKVKLPFYQEWREWGLKNGVKLNEEKIEIPAFFGHGGFLRGVRAKEDIQPGEVIMVVPQKCAMLSRVACNDPVLQGMFAENPALFDMQTNKWAIYNRLLFYMLKEHAKGKESHLYYTINIIETDSNYDWYNDETINSALDPTIRDQMLEVKDRIESTWKLAEPIINSNSQVFEGKVKRKEFNWAYFYLNSRCFGAGMPTLVYVPFIDLINCKPEDNTFFAFFAHLKLEQDPKKASEVGYEPQLSGANISAFFPEMQNITSPLIKTRPYQFLEEFEPNQDLKRLKNQELRERGYRVTKKLLENPNVQVWDIPNWYGNYHELSESPEDIEESGNFVSEVQKLKSVLSGAPRPPYSEDRLKVATAGPSALYDPKEFSSEGFEWYSPEDPDVYLVCFNFYDRVIRKGEELGLKYGCPTSAYLNKYFGFVHPNNPFDSVTFRLTNNSEDPIYCHYTSYEKESKTLGDAEKYGVQYRTKYHQLNVHLISALRARKGHSTPYWRPHSLEDEVEVMKEYKSLFKHYLLHYSRKTEEYPALFDSFAAGKIDYGKYSMYVSEYNNHRIAVQQIRLSNIALHILAEYKSCKDPSQLKEIYMRPREEMAEEKTTETVMALAPWLEQLSLCPFSDMPTTH